MKNKPVIFYEVKSMGLIIFVPFISFILLLVVSFGTNRFIEFLVLNQILCSVPVAFWSAYILYDYLDNDGKELFLTLGRSKMSLFFYKNIIITVLYIFIMMFFSSASQTIFMGEIVPEILIANGIQVFFISGFTLLSTVIIKSSMWAVFIQVVYASSFTGLVRELDFLSVYSINERYFFVGTLALFYKGIILSLLVYSISLILILREKV